MTESPIEPSQRPAGLASPLGSPGEPFADNRTGPPPQSALGRRRADVRVGLLVAAGVALLGPPVGLIWSALAPRAQVVVAAGGPNLADPNTKAFIAADGLFLLLTAGAGVVCAAVSLLLGGRRHGVAAAVGLAAGGLAASYIAWRVGHRVGLAEFRRAVQGPSGAATPLYLTLRARGVLVVWALTGVLTVLAVSVRTRNPDAL